MKMTKKIHLILYIFMLLIITLSLPVCAVNEATNGTEGDSFIKNITDGVHSFQQIGQNQASAIGLNTTTLLGPIRGFAQVIYWIGCIVVIIAILLTAVKAKMNENYANDNAKTKKLFVRLVFIACIVIGAPMIYKIFVTTFNNLLTPETVEAIKRIYLG